MMKWVHDDIDNVYYTDVAREFFVAVPYKRKSMWRFAIRRIVPGGYELIGTIIASLIWKKQATALVKKYISGN
jgi:hypothetical protein